MARVNVGAIHPRIEAIWMDAVGQSLELVSDREFGAEDVWIDGRVFERCHFRGTRIHIALGVFGIALTTGIDADCTVTFHGPAETAWNLADGIGRLKAGAFGQGQGQSH